MNKFMPLVLLITNILVMLVGIAYVRSPEVLSIRATALRVWLTEIVVVVVLAFICLAMTNPYGYGFFFAIVGTPIWTVVFASFSGLLLLMVVMRQEGCSWRIVGTYSLTIFICIIFGLQWLGSVILNHAH